MSNLISIPSHMPAPLLLRSYTSLASSAVILQEENSGIGTAEVDE